MGLAIQLMLFTQGAGLMHVWIDFILSRLQSIELPGEKAPEQKLKGEKFVSLND